MANYPKNNNNEANAEELYGKSMPEQADEFDAFDEIDLTSDSAASDSELEINELLRKYIPEYADEEQTGGGVLSRIKKTAEAERDDDEKLMDALDSAFSFPQDGDDGFDEFDDGFELGDEPEAATGDQSAYSSDFGEEYEEYDDGQYDGYEDQYDDQYDDDGSYNYNEDEIFDDPFADDQPKKIGFFAKLKAKMAENAAKRAEKKAARENEDSYSGLGYVSSENGDEYGDLYSEPGYGTAEEPEVQPVDEYEDLYSEPDYGTTEEPEIQPADEYEDLYSEPDYGTTEEPEIQPIDEYADLFGADDTPAPQSEEPSYEDLFGDDNYAAEDDSSLETVAAEEYAESGEVTAEYGEEYADNGDVLLGDDILGEIENLLGDVADETTDETAGEEQPEEQPTDIDGEFDPTDINLMVAFGLDNGNDEQSGLAKAFGDKLMEKQSRRASKKFKLDRPEFVDKSQIPQLRAEYKKKTTALWIKLGVCGVLSILLLIFENIAAISKLFTGTEQQFAGAFDPAVYPTVYAMVSLQLMLLACLCAFDQIVDGFKALFRGMPKPETITALLAVCGIIYSAIIPRIVVSPSEPVMFNFVVALSALLTLVYAIFNNKREMMNFRVIANKKPKHIVRRLGVEESECETKAFAEADDICDVMKIEKTDFIDGFFGRLSKPDPTTNTFITFLMSISVALAVLIGIFAAFKGCTAAEVCAVIFSSMLILVPLSVFLTFSYPFYRANRSAKEYDSAIIGETSLEEYSNASIISFDDKNVFPSYSVKVQNIRIYNNARIDRVLYYASSVFAYAGGPLQDVFEVATKDMGNSQNVQIFDTEDGFLATQVDGVNIIFGSCEALTERGLEIPANAAEDDVDLSSELEIMYMFRESKLVAKMYIKYVMDADIDLILKQYSGNGLYVCVRTFDPNINERMIAQKLNVRRMPLKIIRYADAEEVSSYEEKVDSGLVTCSSPKSLLQVISYCGKVLHTKKTNIAMSTLSIMIGVAILALLLITNSIGIVNSLLIAIYQLVWTIPMVISSRMFIR